MIRAEEVRIGNLLMHPDGVARPVTLSHIDYLLNDAFQPKNEAVSAIPLTEDWLVRVGFEELGDYFEHPDGQLKYELLYKGNCFNAESAFIVLNSIYYVHQLQNFHFALTGHELKLNQAV